MHYSEWRLYLSSAQDSWHHFEHMLSNLFLIVSLSFYISLSLSLYIYMDEKNMRNCLLILLDFPNIDHYGLNWFLDGLMTQVRKPSNCVIPNMSFILES